MEIPLLTTGTDDEILRCVMEFLGRSDLLGQVVDSFCSCVWHTINPDKQCGQTSAPIDSWPYPDHFQFLVGQFLWIGSSLNSISQHLLNLEWWNGVFPHRVDLFVSFRASISHNFTMGTLYHPGSLGIFGLLAAEGWDKLTRRHPHIERWHMLLEFLSTAGCPLNGPGSQSKLAGGTSYRGPRWEPASKMQCGMRSSFFLRGFGWIETTKRVMHLIEFWVFRWSETTIFTSTGKNQVVSCIFHCASHTKHFFVWPSFSLPVARMFGVAKHRTSHLTPPPQKNYITVLARLRRQHLNHPQQLLQWQYEVQLRGVSRRWMSVWKLFGLEFQTCMVGMAITSQEPKYIRYRLGSLSIFELGSWWFLWHHLLPVIGLCACSCLLCMDWGYVCSRE